MSFNPDPKAACVAPDPVNFAGEDTNSTALAVQALAGVGATDEADAAAGFLDDARNKDGGWPYIPGGDSDPNSTGVALMALRARAVTRSTRTRSTTSQGCRSAAAGAAADQGGITSAFSGGAPDVLSTVQAVPGPRRPQPPDRPGLHDDLGGRRTGVHLPGRHHRRRDGRRVGVGVARGPGDAPTRSPAATRPGPCSPSPRPARVTTRPRRSTPASSPTSVPAPTTTKQKAGATTPRPRRPTRAPARSGWPRSRVRRSARTSRASPHASPPR